MSGIRVSSGLMNFAGSVLLLYAAVAVVLVSISAYLGMPQRELEIVMGFIMGTYAVALPLVLYLQHKFDQQLGERKVETQTRLKAEGIETVKLE